MFAISLHRRAENVTFARALSPGNLALLASVTAHVGVVIVALARGHSPYLADLHALREVPVEARVDNIDVLAEPELPPSRAALPATPPVPASPFHTAPAAVPAVPREVRTVTATPNQVEVAAVAAEPVPSTLPHFVMLAPIVDGNRSASAVGVASSSEGSSGAARVAQADAQRAPVAEQLVDAPAKLLRGAPPSYTQAAESAGIEAEVPLELVVDASGSVQNARSLSHVGYGLDEAALSAVRHYRFAPARRANQLVAVRMRWVMRFQLR